MKAIGRAILSAIFLVLTGLMLAAAKYAPQFVFSFYPAWSRKALAALSSVSALLPIALWEVLAGLAILWLLYTFVCIFTRRRGFLNWLTGVLLAVCVGVFLFTGLWGLNHFGPGVGETLGLDVREYSKEELIAEIGAAALVHHVGLETDRSFRNSTAYLQNWLSVLRNDKRFIVSASGKAEKAVEMILN